MQPQGAAEWTPPAADAALVAPPVEAISNGEDDPAAEQRGHHEELAMDMPDEKEVKMSELLMKQVQFTVESAEQGDIRSKVLVRLEKLIRTWMAKLLRAKGYESPEDHGGRLLTFGSYKLGVHFPGSDIDTLCIAPRDVGRDDFFDSLVNILRKHLLVKDLNPVRDAHVPVIKMNFYEIQIDLVFSALDLDKIPPSPPFNIGADSLLQNLDDPSQRSINGTRVAEKLLRCVPNVDTFRGALRGIKLWAKNRGIYGNIFGFPGGVAWAILTANICQMHPTATPGGVVRNFFSHYRSTIKEEGPNQPIYLTKSLDVSPEITKKSWDRKNQQFELLPVITPMPPFMNSCYNVGRSNLHTLCREFARGDDYITQRMADPDTMDWRELWTPPDFFLAYRIFLQVEVVAMDQANMSSWSAFVESKLRHLVLNLENWPQSSEYHDLAKPSYNFSNLDIRLWPFLFRSTAPTERLHFVESNSEAPSEQSPNPAPQRDEQASIPEDGITGYYFIGLDTCDESVAEGESRQFVDFAGAVDQFYQQLFLSKQTDKMPPPNISLVKRRHVPEWVLSEYEQAQLKKKEMKAALRKEMKQASRNSKKKVSNTGDTPASAPTTPVTPAGQAGAVQSAAA